MKTNTWLTMAACATTLFAAQAQAQDDQAAELAKKLSNPVAKLISVPIQYNHDDYGGLNDGGTVDSVTFQPVIPFGLDADWNVITRTLIPMYSRDGFPLEAMNESGLGDIYASQFLSPAEPTASGIIWGVGPIEVLPTAGEDVLGSGKLGLGPTFVVLTQRGPWTFGYLGAHVWSVAGEDDRADVNVTTMQPFVSFTAPTHTTVGMYTEAAYDWENEQWTVPVIAQVGQMLKIGPQIMQVALAGKYWAEAPENGPEGWGVRAQLTLLFPK